MRITYINVLRLIATLSVVFLHTSAGILDNLKYSSNEYINLSYYKHILEFSVPLFVLISGALFLNPNKTINYSILINKYVRRIVFALVIFGLPMCYIESIFTHTEEIIMPLKNWIMGHSWSHMWYLYMILGLYMITPIIKPFAIKASKKDLKIALSILLILSSILPTLKLMGINISSYMIISTPYIFIYLLGYYVCWRQSSKWLQNKVILTIIILFCSSIIITKCNKGIISYGYADPILITMATSIYLLLKSYNSHNKLADWSTPYCFGVYLIHPFFINLAYKVLGINQNLIAPFYGYIIAGLIFTFLSFLGTYIIMKIPFLKKYVL